MPVVKKTIPEFAAAIKSKYPAYKDVNDTLLTQKWIEKYPVYGKMVDMGDGVPTAPKAVPVETPPAPTPAPPSNEQKPDMFGQVLPFGFTNFDTPKQTQADQYEVQKIGEQSPDKLQKIMDKHGDEAVDKIVRRNDYMSHFSTVLPALRKNPEMKGNELLMPQKKTPDKAIADRNDFYQQAQSNPEAAAQLLDEIGSKNEKLAYDIMYHTYALDAQKTAGTDASLILNNLKEIQDHKIQYNPLTKQLTRTQKISFSTAGPSIAAGMKQHSDLMDDFSFYKSQPKDAVINKLNQMMKANPPNHVTDMPNPILSQAGAMAVPMLKTGVGIGITALSGGEAAPIVAPWIGAAFATPDFMQQEYASALPQEYMRIKQENPNISDEAAYAEADKRANFNSFVAGGVNLGMTGVTAAGVGRVFKLSSLEKNVVTNIVDNTISKTVPEITGVSSLAALGRVIKNLHSGHPAAEGTKDEFIANAVTMGLIHTAGVGLVGAVKTVKPVLRVTGKAIGAALKPVDQVLTNQAQKAAVNILSKLPDDFFANNIATLVRTNKITPEQADAVWYAAKEQQKLNHTLPEDVLEENKAKIHKLIEDRKNLEWKMNPDNPDVVDKAHWPDIKEEIEGVKKETADGKIEGRDGINEQIRQLSKPVKEEPGPVFKEKPEVSVIKPEENKPPTVVPLKEDNSRLSEDQDKIFRAELKTNLKDKPVVMKIYDPETQSWKDDQPRPAKEVYLKLKKQVINVKKMFQECL